MILTMKNVNSLESLEGEIEDLEYELNIIIEDHLQLLYQSLFIAVYSRFERYLIDLCNNIRKSESLSLNPRDLRQWNQTFTSAYFEKVAHLNFPANTKEWRVILTSK